MLGKVNSIKILPRWIIFLIDTVIVGVAFSLSYLLRYNFEVGKIDSSQFGIGLLVFLALFIVGFVITKSYSGIVRYTSIQDGLRILLTVGIGELFVLIFNILSFDYFERRLIPLSVVVISYFVAVFLLFIYRVAVKNIFAYYASALKSKFRVAVFGAGEKGIITKQILENDSGASFKVVAYFEDNKEKVDKNIQGVKIYDGVDALQKTLVSLGVKELVLADADLSISRKNEIVDHCLRNGVKIRSIPDSQSWAGGKLSASQIREVRIEDLLGRESIRLNDLQVEHDLQGKSVVITGAAGSIGSEIARQVAGYRPSALILIDQSESDLFEIELELAVAAREINCLPIVADITNKPRMEAIIRNYNPDIIYHAAAYKHVPMMEKNPIEAVLCNVLGTKIVADLAFENHVGKFVMVSTDKAVNPTSVMGASKRVAEMYVQSLNNFKVSDKKYYTRFVTTRFGNVLGSNGSVIPLFKRQIAKGGPITVTHPDVTRYFMTIPEACQLVLEAGAMGNGGEIFIFDMGESIKIVDLAKKMIMLSGLEYDKDIQIHFTGLREGEKLYEELLNPTENTTKTHHEKIMIARVLEEPYLKVAKEVDSLIEIANQRDELVLVGQMKKMIPEYQSNYSRFEVLDQKAT